MVPRIRFKGFTDPWEQRKASDVFGIRDDRGYPKLPVLSATQDQGMIYRDESGRFVSHNIASEANYKRVLPGNFAIHLRSFEGGFAHSSYEGITSPAYTIFAARDTDKQCDRFWKHLFTSDRFIDSLRVITYGIRDGRSINIDEFMDLLTTFPSIDEQKQIGICLDALDNLITLHQRKHEKLVQMKKAMLDKMFPKPGAKFPEIRFEGFTDPWEQRKLGKLCSFTKGRGYSKADICDSGIPLIHYGRLYTQYQMRIEVVDTFAVEHEDSLFSRGNEVIVPASGETAEDIAIASSVRRSGVMLGGDLNVVIPSSELDPDYVALGITYGRTHDDLAKRAQGKSVVHIHNDDIAEVDFPYPAIREQQAIAALVLNLDNLITLHRRECMRDSLHW